MKALFTICVFVIAFCFCNAVLPETVIIETKYGKVEGDVIKLPNEDFAVAAFKGIPFGSVKRFQKPDPVKPWKDILNARNWGKRCLQHQTFGKLEAVMAEDVSHDQPDVSEECLLLNVFAPYEKESRPRPVMVFIHGGGFGVGSANEYGQEGIVNWMVPKGVVFVTINYRLGSWGFFTTGTKDAPGNYGLWDQTLALKWVHDNIDRFGGDPKKVTIFGESAGAISVALLALSPHSRDLFQQSIIMSGSSYIPWHSAIDGNSLEAADILLTALNCGSIKEAKTEADTRRAIQCIKTKSPEEILKALYSYRPYGKFEYVGFIPVYDGDFFPEPLEKLQATAPPKPVISGTATDEMGAFVTSAFAVDFEWTLKDPESFSIDQLADKLQYFLPEKRYHEWTPLVHQLALHHYVDSVGDRRNNSFVVEKYKELFGDFLFLNPAYKEALERHQRGSKVWLYAFDYYDNALFPKDFKFKSAQHYFELPYLFEMPKIHPSPFKGDDKKVKDVMTTLWTNFAIYGHPNPEQSPIHKEFSWEPITDQYLSRYLHICPHPEQRHLFNRRMVSFWHELLPKVLTLVHGGNGVGGKPIRSEL